MVHRRFVHVWDHLGDEAVEKISAESLQEAQQAISENTDQVIDDEESESPEQEEELEEPAVPQLSYAERLRLREEEKVRAVNLFHL